MVCWAMAANAVRGFSDGRIPMTDDLALAEVPQFRGSADSEPFRFIEIQPLQLGKPLDVHHVPGCEDALLERDQQIGPPGENHGVRAVPFQEGASVLQGIRPNVIERRHGHEPFLFFFPKAASTLSGVMGRS